jgi:hypothetical protein
MDDRRSSGRWMLIIGAHEGQMRLACECCGAHAIRPSSLLFWVTRCHVCGEIAEIHGPRERISDTRPVRLSFERSAATVERPS